MDITERLLTMRRSPDIAVLSAYGNGRMGGDMKVRSQFVIGLAIGSVLALSGCKAESSSDKNTPSAMAEAAETVPAAPSVDKIVQEQKDYIAKSLDVYGVETRRHKDDPGVNVKFKLRNRGDRTVGLVRVRVEFLDQSGSAMAEDEFVVINSYEFHSPPLRPGYSWQSDHGYAAEHVPSEWNSGKARASIIQINFTNAS